VGDDDLVTHCNLIVSTTHNNQAMNEAVRAVAREQFDGREITEGLLNHIEVAIRAYDPCLSCATHAMGRMPWKWPWSMRTARPWTMWPGRPRALHAAGWPADVDGLTPPPARPPALPAAGLGQPQPRRRCAGPLLLDRIQRWLMQQPASQHRAVQCLEDQQLQVEHVLDLQGRQAVLLIDAAVGLSAPFSTMALTLAGTAASPATPSPAGPAAGLSGCARRSSAAVPAAGSACRSVRPGPPPTPQALADLDLAEAWLRTWVQQNAAVEAAEPGAVTQ
jgi:hypothetical protein